MPSQAADQHGADLDALCADLAAKNNIIVASNRGPVTFAIDQNDRVSVSNNAVSGGLSALQGRLPLTWISFAASGADRAAADQATNGLISRGLPDGWGARLVSPSRRAYHRFYNVVCNPLLWFLHHHSWGFTHTPNIDREAYTAWDQGMAAVSRMFADQIAAEAARSQKPAVVMLRDYHMHLVAGMVRERVPDAVLHYVPDVPWPGPDGWMALPAAWRRDLFSSLLACDVVGVTSERDARNLLSCFEEFSCGVEVDRTALTVLGSDGRKTLVRVYPPSVDQEGLMETAHSRRTETFIDRLKNDVRHTFVTAERVEPHRNIVRSIRAYGNLLARDPSLASTTRYLLVLAPPPPHLSQYRRYMREIEQAAKEVNGKHRGQPVELVVENNYPRALAALQVADTVISVPIADASCATALAAPLINQRSCTLILSETSSAAKMFKDAAAIVAPSDVEALTDEMDFTVRRTSSERAAEFAKSEAVALAQATDVVMAQQIADLVSLTGKQGLS